MAFFGPWVGEIDVETVHRLCGYGIGDENGGFGADYAYVFQVPSADTVDAMAVVFSCPFDAEKIDIRLVGGLVEQESTFAAADFDMNGARTSENSAKIDLAV